MHEFTVRCLECGITHSQGGFDQPLSEADILAKAFHNPGCRIASGGYDPEREYIQVDQQQEDNVAIYHLSLVMTEK